MGLLSYTTSQIQKALDYCIDPTIFTMRQNSDTPSDQVISSADVYQDIVFTDVDAVTYGDFTYDGDVLTYTGASPILMQMNLACNVSSSVVNTTIHLEQFKNDLDDIGAESSTKCESVDALQTIGFSTPIILQPGDVLDMKIKSDKIATIGIWHFQVVLKQIKSL